MKPTPIDLSRAVVAITGAGRGIGRATAVAFAARGATVAIGDIDAQAAQEAAEHVGDGAQPFALDVTTRTSFSDFVEAVQDACGPIDVLVNNAGIMPVGPFLEESDATAAAQLDVNVHGPLLGMKLVLPGMLERRRGHVINLASYAGKVVMPGMATYCASKHALIGLTAAVQRELDGTGVTVTAICPGAVDTALASGLPVPFARFALVAPQMIADAAVHSVKGRPREMVVPGWIRALKPLTDLAHLLPGVISGPLRELLGEDTVLRHHADEGRTAYHERLARDNVASTKRHAR
jgi:NAD(P)-dependent dehydrogenase (short-subunit alcohol dehydrogenase family)